jgi:hypothetical protein
MVLAFRAVYTTGTGNDDHIILIDFLSPKLQENEAWINMMAAINSNNRVEFKSVSIRSLEKYTMGAVNVKALLPEAPPTRINHIEKVFIDLWEDLGEDDRGDAPSGQPGTDNREYLSKSNSMFVIALCKVFKAVNIYPQEVTVFDENTCKSWNEWKNNTKADEEEKIAAFNEGYIHLATTRPCKAFEELTIFCEEMEAKEMAMERKNTKRRENEEEEEEEESLSTSCSIL